MTGRRAVLAAIVCLWPLASTAELNISIATFDPGVPEDYSLHQDLDVFPKIREIESLFLPFVLRQALVDAGDWGAVRVVPESDDAAVLDDRIYLPPHRSRLDTDVETRLK